MNDETTTIVGQEQIEALEARIKELEDKLAAHGEHGRKIHELEDNAKAEAKHLYNELEPFLEKFKNEEIEIEEVICSKIRKHPGASLALAFGAGLLAAALFDHRKH